VLTYHVVSGAVTSSQLHDGQVIGTLDAGNSVTAHVQGNNVEINNARVLRANIMCTNGVIHIVDHVLVPGNFNYPKNDIPATAESVAALSTLVTALKTGNLVRQLSYPEGPFTVFAPTNQAFTNLPAGVLAYLLAHPQELDAVLAYHVVDARGDRGRGRLYADEIHNFQEVFTLNGQSLVFVLAGGKVLVNGNATVVQANVDTSNGVVHVIDTVLIPNQRALEARAAAWNAKNLRAQLVELGAEPNLLQLAQSVPQLSTLVTAVTAAGIGSVLAGKGPLTVFAPNSESAGRRRAHASCLRACACEILRLRNSKRLTAPPIPNPLFADDAFAKLPADFLKYLLGNKAALTKVLTYHVAAGNFTSGTLVDGQNITTAEGSDVHIFKDRRGAIFVNFAQVIAPNNMASNGVAHIISDVLLPEA
jgi:uncharacterized surface protein with fasciclin (FAS1) repeats